MDAGKAWPFPLQHEPPKELAKSVSLQVLLCFLHGKASDNVWLYRVTNSPISALNVSCVLGSLSLQASWHVGHPVATSFFSLGFIFASSSYDRVGYGLVSTEQTYHFREGLKGKR